MGILGSPVDLDIEASPGDFQGVGLSRIPPRVFIRNKSALNDIRLGIQGLLSCSTKEDEAPLEIIALGDSRLKNIPRNHTTLVVRLKGNVKMMAMLRLRCDTIGVR